MKTTTPHQPAERICATRLEKFSKNSGSWRKPAASVASSMKSAARGTVRRLRLGSADVPPSLPDDLFFRCLKAREVEGLSQNEQIHPPSTLNGNLIVSQSQNVELLLIKPRSRPIGQGAASQRET